MFNAGIAAHHLGGPSMTLATVGGSPWAQIEQELRDLVVPHRLIRTEAATRICTTIVDRAGDTITELVENNVLTRRQGRGTFVSTHDTQRALFHFFHIADNKGHKVLPDSNVLSCRRKPACSSPTMSTSPARSRSARATIA